MPQHSVLDAAAGFAIVCGGRMPLPWIHVQLVSLLGAKGPGAGGTGVGAGVGAAGTGGTRHQGP